MLRSRFLRADQVEAIVRGDFAAGGVTPAEAAMMAYVRNITLHAYKVTPRDVEGLRAHGFSDEEILDIAFAASARNFFSKVVDAVGAEPDPAYLEIDEDFRRVLAVGRPFEPAAGEAPSTRAEGLPD